MAKKLSILLFINGPAPTEAEFNVANNLTDMKHTVSFRNALAVDSTDTVEVADFFCGAVPELYKKRCPKVPVIQVDENGKRVAAAIVATGATPAAALQPQISEADAKAAERAKVDAWASTAKVEELKQALAHFGIKFEDTAKKAELLQLFLSRP